MNPATFGSEFFSTQDAPAIGGCPAKWMDLKGHLYYGCNQIE